VASKFNNLKDYFFKQLIMKIKKGYGSFLKNKIMNYLIITVLYSVLFVLVLFTSVKNVPFIIGAGNYEFSRGVYVMLFFGLTLISFREYRRNKKGFEGENLVTSFLAKHFEDDYYLINDPTTLDSYGNIDHIILAPNGVFTLEIRNNRGKVTFFGEYWDHGRSPVKQAKINAFKTYDLLHSSKIFSYPLFTQGIVVFPYAEVFFSPKPETPVLRLEEASEYIKSVEGERRYSNDDLEKMYNIITKQIAQSANNEGGLSLTVREWLGV